MARPKKEAPNHASGMYEIKATVGHDYRGKAIRKSFYSSISKTDAKSKAEQYKINKAVASATGESLPIAGKTFEYCADTWLEAVKSSVEDKTYEVYETTCRLHLKPYFQKARISNIDLLAVQTYFNQYELKAPKETMSKYKHTLSKIFDFSLINNWCQTNPCKYVKMPKPKPDKQKEVYTLEETSMVLEFCFTHKQGLKVALMLEYGLRIGELFGLRWIDFDKNNKKLRLRKAAADVKDKNTGKYTLILKDLKNKPSNRDIPLSQQYIDLIDALPRAGEMIFSNSKGGLMSPNNWTGRDYKWFIYEVHEYVLDKYKIELPRLSPHELRHTCATILVNSGKNIFAIAKLLGHTDLKMLEKRYAHNDVESTRKLLGIE